jgi:hypothetical protein
MFPKYEPYAKSSRLAIVAVDTIDTTVLVREDPLGAIPLSSVPKDC